MAGPAPLFGCLGSLWESFKQWIERGHYGNGPEGLSMKGNALRIGEFPRA